MKPRNGIESRGLVNPYQTIHVGLATPYYRKTGCLRSNEKGTYISIELVRDHPDRLFPIDAECGSCESAMFDCSPRGYGQIYTVTLDQGQTVDVARLGPVPVDGKHLMRRTRRAKRVNYYWFQLFGVATRDNRPVVQVAPVVLPDAVKTALWRFQVGFTYC